MHFILLWTDILLWASFLTTIFAIYFIYRSNDLKQKWQKIFSYPVAVITFIIFLFYVAIALIDSIHFKINHQVKIYSMLDKLLEPALNSSEKTYSKPLDYKQFDKEYLANGLRGYPKLQYVDVHIDSTQELRQDILKKTFLAFMKWGIFSVILLLLYLYFYPTGLNSSAKKAAVITLSALSFICFWIAEILPHYHIFGTDKAGIDVFYKSMKSIRTGLLFGFLTTIFALPFAIILGLLAGYFGGRLDDIIQFIYTTINAIPSILLIAALVVILQVYMDKYAHEFSSALMRADMKLLLLCGVLAMTSWTSLCRLVRAETLKLRSYEFITAARIFGVAHWRILFSHLLPNVMHLVLITIVLDFSALVLIEAVLSYVGIGVDATTMSWGNMINGARLELTKTPIVWWSLLAAFLFMFILVLSVNLFSDKVREVFDPRSK